MKADYHGGNAMKQAALEARCCVIVMNDGTFVEGWLSGYHEDKEGNIKDVLIDLTPEPNSAASLIYVEDMKAFYIVERRVTGF